MNCLVAVRVFSKRPRVQIGMSCAMDHNVCTRPSCDGSRGFMYDEGNLGTTLLGCFGRATFCELAKNIEGCDAVGFSIRGKVEDIVDKRFDRCAALKR